MKRLWLSLSAVLVFLPLQNVGWSWGERGHDIVSRVAVRILLTRFPKNPELTRPFLIKENMLGHLANVPDIVWRNNSEDAAKKFNSPTHFIDLEFLQPSPTLSNLPSDFTEAKALAAKNGYDIVNQVGTLPWRMSQFIDLLKMQMQKIPKSGNLAPSVDDMLQTAGLLSHFIADATMPLHVTQNYDGQLTEQKGLHEYFETQAVDALGLDLDDQVLASALEQKPWMKISRQPKLNSTTLPFDLVVSSFYRVSNLLDLDRRISLETQSGVKNKKSDAPRKPASQIAADFAPLIIQQLALASDCLATIWVQAWQEAGKPDMSKYHSWNYATHPGFIFPDYLKP